MFDKADNDDFDDGDDFNDDDGGCGDNDWYDYYTSSST